MGSSRKHKEDKKEKKSHKSERRRRHSRSASPPQAATETTPRKRKHEKRREESDDSDVPASKSRREQRSRSPSVEKPSGDGSSLSIDETNRLRAKLGLKPLEMGATATASKSKPAPRPASATRASKDGEEGVNDEAELIRIREEREAEGQTFWKEDQEFVHKPAANITANRKSAKLKEKIETMKEKRALESKVLGSKTLGHVDSDEDDDAGAWVARQKAKTDAKALAARREKELDEMDEEFGIGPVVASQFVKAKSRAYTERDIKGMKVLHDHSRIKEGSQLILTLQDKDVLDETDDNLVNVNLLDDERYDKNLANKASRPEHHGYNALDEDEFGYDAEGNLKGRSLLKKYDEELEGPTRASFAVGQDLSEDLRMAKIREKMAKSDKILESAGVTNLTLASDFYSPDEMVAFKKPKKKLRRVVKGRALKADDLLKLDADAGLGPEGVINQRDLGRGARPKVELGEIEMDVDDLGPLGGDVDISDVKLEDEADIDFQRALSATRKMKQKGAARPKPKSNIADLILADRNESAEDRGRQIGQSFFDDYDAGGSGAGSAIMLNSTAEFCRTLGDIPSVDPVDLYGDEEMDFEQEERFGREVEERGAWNEVDMDETPAEASTVAEAYEAPILEQEPEVGVGIAGALKLAQKKGYLEKEKLKRGASNYMKHLQAKNYTIEDKNYEEEGGGGGRGGHGHHGGRGHGGHGRDHYSGPSSDFREKEGYKPEVKLEYYDEDGKQISAKEAFRELSHKFHGKGSGKNKIDKKRKKAEQEKLLQHMSSGDTPLGTLELLQQRQKATHTPYLILSGSKAAASLMKAGKRK